MTDGAVNIRPGDTTHGPRTGQRAGNGQKHKEHQRQETEGPWTPSRARHGSPKEKPSMAAMFDRLAKAAAAHDGEVLTGIFGERASTCGTWKVPVLRIGNSLTYAPIMAG